MLYTRIIFALGALLLYCAAFSNQTATRPAAARQQQEASEEVRQGSEEEPTVVELGKRSGEQAERAKLFAPMRAIDVRVTGKTIPELLATHRGELRLTYEASNLDYVAVESISPALSDDMNLRGLACDADLIVVGTILGKSSQLNEGESFVFTDYQFRVDEVITGTRAPGVVAGQTITVTRPGGLISLQGRRVRASVESFPTFGVGGEYLFLLKATPIGGAYRAFADGSFRVAEGMVEPVSDQNPLGPAAHEVGLFSRELRLAITKPCGSRKLE